MRSQTFEKPWTISPFLGQYCGQNLGCPFSERAIVTKVLVLGAGFFQAMPLVQMPRNTRQQMFIEGAALQTRHRKRAAAAGAVRLRGRDWVTSFEFGQRQRTQAGTEVKGKLGL